MSQCITVAATTDVRSSLRTFLSCAKDELHSAVYDKIEKNRAVSKFLLEKIRLKSEKEAFCEKTLFIHDGHA